MNIKKGILKVYLEDENFVIECLNDEGQSHKEVFRTEEKFLSALEKYKPTIDQYDVKVQEEVILPDGITLLKKTFFVLFGQEEND